MNLLSKAIVPGTILLITGCTEDLSVFNQNPDQYTIEAHAVAAKSESQTRTAIDPTEYTSGQIGINWIPSDKIGVYGNSTSTNIPFVNNNDKENSSAIFSGQLTASENALYAYYPYSPSAGNDYHNVKGNLASTQNYSILTRTLDNDWKVGKPTETKGVFTFEHMFAFLHFQVNADGTDIKGETLESISLSIPGKQLCGEFTYDLSTNATTFNTATGSDLIEMKWVDSPILSAQTFDGFISCAPVQGIEGKELQVKINTSHHVATFSVTCSTNAIERGYYYTLPLSLSRFKDTWVLEERDDNLPDAAWVSGVDSRLACANMVFSKPSTPFMHKIRVSDNNKIVKAYNLPQGLTWNSKRRLVEGQIDTEGDYTYSVEVRNADGSLAFTEGIKLKVSNDLIQPTPMMGWQSWNVLGKNISHDKLLAQAQKMIDLGLLDAGYNYLGVDDFWSKDYKSRDNGTNYPTVNSSKFPSGMKAFTDAVHALGLKVGIYTDAGNVTCGKDNTGSYDYEETDAKAFTEWGFDMLKEDWYTTEQLKQILKFDYTETDKKFPWQATTSAYTLYKRMGDAIKNNGNKILLYMCEWGIHDPYKWAAETGATCWRVTYDGREGWNGSGNTGTSVNDGGIGLRNTIDLMRHLWSYNGVNRFNDPDMICVGIRGNGESSNDLVDGKAGFNDYENETAFAMWCMWSAPILLGMDMTKEINAHDLALMKNKELIAIDQDPMCQAAEYIKSEGNNSNNKNVDYYMKDLANGDVAIAAVNLGDKEASYNIKLEDYDALDASCSYKLRDVIKLADAGEFSVNANKSGTLPAHATVVYRLSKK